MRSSIDVIFVPQGAEYQAVYRGLRSIANQTAEIVPVPVGPRAVSRFLQDWHLNSRQFWQEPVQVLMMGLCGSLSPRHAVGDAVIYQSCYDGSCSPNVPPKLCDLQLSQSLAQGLPGSVTAVTAVTCDRILCKASEKRQLAQRYPATVVDMEGFTALALLQNYKMAVSMLRVVSDAAEHDLPDLNAALSESGQLLPWPMAMGMIRRPRASLRLIRGSLQGLKQLEQLAAQLGGR
ncbi:MAG: hypothetical protein HC934_04035 [Acaryochloridaceae cyanobacterium SU_2_1]|nr:hypothetical protein [Acaryochloridaceae cyanobacterium SU_2_1]